MSLIKKKKKENGLEVNQMSDSFLHTGAHICVQVHSTCAHTNMSSANSAESVNVSAR
jgi:hypothetical protein